MKKIETLEDALRQIEAGQEENAELHKENGTLTVKVSRLNDLIKLQKNIISHKDQLGNYIRFFENAEPEPNNYLVVLDEEYKIRYVSERASKIFGYESQKESSAIIGLHYQELITAPEKRNAFEEAIKNKTKLHLVGLLSNKKGKVALIRTRIMYYIPTTQGYTMGVVLRVKKA